MHRSPELTKLIRQNLWIVLSFVYGRPAISEALERHFKGEWKPLWKVVTDHSELQADRALLEMATQLRVLDDGFGVGAKLQENGGAPLGSVIQADGQEQPLYFRDVTNKALHGAGFTWVHGDKPTVIIWPANGDRWQRATVDLLALTAVVGILA